MSSESKKRKADCDTHQRYGRFTNGFALKWKGRRKRGFFYNSAQRMQEKQNFRKLKDEVQKDEYEYRSDDQRT